MPPPKAKEKWNMIRWDKDQCFSSQPSNWACLHTQLHFQFRPECHGSGTQCRSLRLDVPWICINLKISVSWMKVLSVGKSQGAVESYLTIFPVSTNWSVVDSGHCTCSNCIHVRALHVCWNLSALKMESEVFYTLRHEGPRVKKRETCKG